VRGSPSTPRPSGAELFRIARPTANPARELRSKATLMIGDRMADHGEPRALGGPAPACISSARQRGLLARASPPAARPSSLDRDVLRRAFGERPRSLRLSGSCSPGPRTFRPPKWSVVPARPGSGSADKNPRRSDLHVTKSDRPVLRLNRTSRILSRVFACHSM